MYGTKWYARVLDEKLKGWKTAFMRDEKLTAMSRLLYKTSQLNVECEFWSRLFLSCCHLSGKMHSFKTNFHVKKETRDKKKPLLRLQQKIGDGKFHKRKMSWTEDEMEKMARWKY